MEKKEPEEINSEKHYSIEEAENNFKVNEAQIDYTKRRYTIEEYLEMERASNIKHEYYQGEIFAMAGASPIHNRIFSNVFIKAGNQLLDKPCRPYGSDMRMHIPENTLFTYPDISIYCDDPESFDDNEDNKINPTVIIEILSPSTRAYDLGKKFEFYQTIPTLKEYIVIDTEHITVKCWRITAPDQWVLEEYKSLHDTVIIPAVEVSLLMQDIYKGTQLAKLAL